MRILVTGGARRIGAGLVNHFCRQGHTVVVHYNQSHTAALKLQEKWGERVLLLQADLSKDVGVANIVEQLQSRFEYLDAIVNNAAVFQRQVINEVRSADLTKMWSVNAVAPIQLIQGTLDLLKKGHGAVVNMVDNVSHTRPWPNHSAYAASKAALVAITRSLAIELAPDIRVNGVGPGLIYLEDSSQWSHLVRNIPMGRMGTVDEIAACVEFLLFGPEYITGQVLNVDGGWSLTP